MATRMPVGAGGRWCVLTLVALAVAPALPALGQDIEALVTYRPDNRAGSAAAAAVIAEMIAERSQSAAVRSRARAMAPSGSFVVGAEELLLDIEAHGHIAALRGDAALVPAALPPPVEPLPPDPAPVVEAAPPPAPTVAPAPAPVNPAPVAPAPVAGPAAPAATASTAAQRRPNWGVSETFSGTMRDAGGSPGGGGGAGGGGSTGGGGGGGWN